jgi:hypothetical protein
MQSAIYWPVGSSLRFTAEVGNMPGCAYLAETAVLVLTPPRDISSVRLPDRSKPMLEQMIYSFAAGGESWVQTSLLEPIPVSMMSAYRSKRWPVQKS